MHGEHILCQIDSAGSNVAHKTSPFRWSIGNAHTLQSWHSRAPSGRGSPLHSLGGADRAQKVGGSVVLFAKFVASLISQIPLIAIALVFAVIGWRRLAASHRKAAT